MDIKEYLIESALQEEKTLPEASINMKKKYIAPIIEVEEINVEKGFAGSYGHAYGNAGKWDEIETFDEWD